MYDVEQAEKDNALRLACVAIEKAKVEWADETQGMKRKAN